MKTSADTRNEPAAEDDSAKPPRLERPRTRRGIKAIDIVLVVILIAVAVGAYLFFLSPDETQAAANTTTVQRGTVEATVSASGTVESPRTYQASFVASGKVTAVFVHVGSHVKKHDVMARLKTPEGTMVRLKAPVTGTVTAVDIGVGTTVGTTGGTSVTLATGDSTTSDSTDSTTSSASVEVANLASLVVRAYFSETDVSQLDVGKSATVTFDALGRSVDAVITHIDVTSTTQNNVVEYGATLRLDRQPSDLRPGQTATVEVVTERARDALLVPSASVQNVGGQTVVTVLRNGQRQQVQVTVGVESDQTTEITSGLSEGDEVVIPTTTSQNGFPGGGFPGGGLGIGGGPGGGD